jgi:hypothetical protein
MTPRTKIHAAKCERAFKGMHMLGQGLCTVESDLGVVQE